MPQSVSAADRVDSHIGPKRSSPGARVAPGETGVSSNAGAEGKGFVPIEGETLGTRPAGLLSGVDASDGDLILRARRGDRDAFSILVVRYQDAVYGLAWRILRSREDAEDAAQESFLRALRGLSTFDPSHPFRPWILRIAANFALTLRSRRRPHVELDEAIAAEKPSDSGLPAPAVAASRREILDAVRHLAEELSPENAALFHLRYEEDLSLKEIARILGRRPGALAVTLHRIRERFRRALFGGKKEEGVEP